MRCRGHWTRFVDHLDASDELRDSAVLYDTTSLRANHVPPSNDRTHALLSDFPSSGALQGQTVKARLRVAEDEVDASSWVIDNGSFSHSDWGLQIGG
jgi:hypothetical protein